MEPKKITLCEVCFGAMGCLPIKGVKIVATINWGLCSTCRYLQEKANSNGH